MEYSESGRAKGKIIVKLNNNKTSIFFEVNPKVRQIFYTNKDWILYSTGLNPFSFVLIRL